MNATRSALVDVPGVARSGLPAGLGAIAIIANVSLCETLVRTCDLYGRLDTTNETTGGLHLLVFPRFDAIRRWETFQARLHMSYNPTAAAITALTDKPAAHWLRSLPFLDAMLTNEEWAELNRAGTSIPRNLEEVGNCFDLSVARDTEALTTTETWLRYHQLSRWFSL